MKRLKTMRFWTMGEFLGWASYDIRHFCPYCNESYDPEDMDGCCEEEDEDGDA